MFCANGEHRDTNGQPHQIPDGARRISVPALTVEWGDHDLRENWTGGYVFCSFGCLEEKAGDWAAEHDSHTLVEGPKPEGDEPA